ncbi:hypothetical protein DPMN_166132 [Dreissena polymorpha]|uniref:Uncharacterized protein n=1 Tax=Dreissena polymorpha TaxID=45954 RepID=A0A9D4EWA0_DREPO|nr:hypothetical protein DPMN_166132 [Dreissena polymorpha]
MGGKTRHKGNRNGNPAAHGVREKTAKIKIKQGEVTVPGGVLTQRKIITEQNVKQVHILINVAIEKKQSLFENGLFEQYVIKRQMKPT